jgi:hypothetical protein
LVTVAEVNVAVVPERVVMLALAPRN